MASSDYATDDAGSSLNTNLATLLSMGFDGNQSKEALSKNEGNVLRAIDFLTSEMNEKKSTGAALLRSGGDADQLDTVGENDAKPPLPPSQIDELNECKRNKIESVHLEIVDDNVDAPKPPESTEAEGIHQTQTEKTIDYSDGEKKSIAFNGRKQLSMQKMLEPTVNVAELMSGSTHFVEENDPSPTCSPIHPDNTSSISQNTTNPIFVEVEATPVEDQNTIYDAILVPEDPRPEYNVDESRENTNPPPRWKRYQVLILMALILIIGVLLGTMISFGLSKNGSNNVQNELKLPGVDGSDPMGEGTENYLTNAPTPDADSGGKSPVSLISSSLEPTSNPTSSRIASATPTFSAKISSKPPTTEPSQPPYRPIATTTPTSRKSAHPTQPPTPLPSRTPTNPPTPFPFALHSSHPTPNPSRPVHPAVKPILDILKPSRPISPPTGRPNTPTAQETPAPWSQSIPGSPPFLDFPIPGFPIPGVPSDFEESETSDEPDLSKPPYEVGQTCIGEDCTIVGRPYYDESGTLITAKSKLTCMGASQHTRSEWSTGEFCSTLSTKSKQKSRNHLGLDWTNRALGEHASIASFSAFSITLMTNGAPTSLVEESLEAGLDEIRHAKTSFEIASVLLGKEVGPGPLPESHVSFDGNLTKMAFAIAQEGCIDETFSAIAAYSEAVYIESIMQGASGKTPYSEIDQATLLWIRDELQIIGAEESKHSLLAWRAFSWVCDIDLHICEMVWENVMTKSNLEKALKIHLGLNFESNVDFAEIIAEQGWSVVHSYTTEDQLDEWVLGLFRTSSHELR